MKVFFLCFMTIPVCDLNRCLYLSSRQTKPLPKQTKQPNPPFSKIKKQPPIPNFPGIIKGRRNKGPECRVWFG
ncbi:hypothetical protein QBC44DRAFT_68054 [Cladorrhinum sp. PSN332]|nr:hypothetical protein QBC44DRAFT_68054 [Cladorrhinum sp. PSN332]